MRAIAKQVLQPMHHCFRLHFVVQPGGSRKTEYHVLGTLGEVKAAALADLGSPEGAYHALLYGEDILLQCWENGRKVATIDLHPFISYQLVEGDEARTVTFAGPGDEPALDMEEADEDGTPLYERLMDGAVAIAVTIDWDRVPLPALGGSPLPPGTEVLLDGESWAYGLHGEWDCYAAPSALQGR